MAELKGVDDLGNMKTRISSSKLSGGERSFDESKHGSKCDEADMQSSEGGASTQPTSVKSEISVEMNLPLGNGRHNAAEDGLNTMTSQQRTESSCSNSLPVVLPVSLSNQETSKEAHVFRNCGSSMDSSNERSPEEPVVTASSESGISAQIASKAVKNAKERNSMKVSASYDNLDSSFNCTGRTAESTHCREETGEILREVENALATKGETVENGEFWVKEPSKYAVKDQDKSFAGFDLNEDINTNTLDDYIQPVGETVSSHSVIHVVAKAAILIGHPRIPLKFEGGLGWKGSAETSAFRPASLSKNSTRSTDHVPKDELCSTGFDLNVAAEDDNDGVLQDSHSEVDSKQTERLFDLNCLYDANDELTPKKSENRADLNSNSLTSVAEKSNGLHWLHQGNKISDPGRQDFDFSSHDYLSNLNTMRHLGNIHHTLAGAPNMMQRVASTQPPHGYSYKDPFHFGAGSMPYTRFYGNAPHLQQVVHEQNTSHIPASIPNFFDVKTEDNSWVNGSNLENPRQFPFFPKSSPMGQQMHQEAWYAASMKRKEPEGGLECFQLGYKQVL